MKTERKVKSKSDIINHLNKMYKPFGAEIEEIKFKHVGMDERIGWETYYVLQRFKDPLIVKLFGNLVILVLFRFNDPCIIKLSGNLVSLVYPRSKDL